METQQQNGKPSGWKAAGRAASFMFLPQWFFVEASGAKRDAGRLARMVLSILHLDEHYERVIAETWNQTMIMHQFTEVELRRQMFQRQMMAWFFYTAMLANFAAAILYAPMGWITGALFLVWYLKQVLTMFQIRVHWLCGFGEYLLVCMRYPAHPMPMGLPRGWTLLDKEPGKEMEITK